MSVVGVPMLLGPILGPVIGGVIVDTVSWHWIFLVNVAIAAVALALAARLLAADAGRDDAGRLDWLGVALLSPGLAAVVFGLSQTQEHAGIGDPITFVPMVCGLALVALFVAHSLRAFRPLIDARLFRSRGFSAAAATTFTVGAALFGAMLVLPLYYQLARGKSALMAGVLMAPQGLGAALAMPIAGRLTDRLGGGRVTAVGCVIITLATLPLVAIVPDASFALLACVLVLRGVGMGAAMMPSMAAANATLTPPQVPRATSALNALQRVGGSVGTALLAVTLQHHLRASGPTAAAFGSTFEWAAAITIVGLIPALLLARADRPGHAPAAMGDGGFEPRAAA